MAQPLTVPLRVAVGKTVVPELPAEFTPRPALRQRLDEATPGQVIVVSAPAGSGKTLLLADWVRQEERLETAWISLDADDNDPRRLWSAVLASLLALSSPSRGVRLQRVAAAGAGGAGGRPRRGTRGRARRPRVAGAGRSRRRARTDRPGGAAGPHPVDPPQPSGAATRPGQPDGSPDLRATTPTRGPVARAPGRRPALHARRHRRDAESHGPRVDGGAGGRAAGPHGRLGCRAPARRPRAAPHRRRVCLPHQLLG